MGILTESAQKIHETETVCRHCGVVGEYRAVPAKPPHWKALRCTACRRHIRFISKTPLEVREANRRAGIRQWMSAQKPTAKQLRYLKRMAYSGDKPTNRLNASELIDAMKRQREW